MNLRNSLRKKDKMFGKPRILSLFPNSFNVRSSILTIMTYYTLTMPSFTVRLEEST